MPYNPNAELVTITWLKGIAGLPLNQIGTTLPKQSDDFAANGFINVQAIGGVPDQDTFMQNSTLQIDTWAYNANSAKPPWGRAATLAMDIKAGLEEPTNFGIITTPSAYYDARVMSVRVLTDFRRIIGEDGNFARYSADFHVHWVPVRV